MFIYFVRRPHFIFLALGFGRPTCTVSDFYTTTTIKITFDNVDGAVYLYDDTSHFKTFDGMIRNYIVGPYRSLICHV